MEKIRSLLLRKPVRYFISSVAAFAVNYAMLLVLERLLRGFSGLSMEIAAVPAFLVSSQLNFRLNRRWVFRSEKRVLPELLGYYSLAAVSFLIKAYVLLEIFVRIFRIPLALAQPIAEAVMFLVNYALQKTVIFNKKKR